MKFIQVYENVICITNDKYREGVMHVGTNRHPNIGADYTYLQYCDNMLHESFWVDKNNLRQNFNANQINKLDAVVSSWVQELGQQGNPTEKQALEQRIVEAKTYLTDTGWIWEKYNRNVLVLKDMTNEEFSLKYSDIISKQEEYRLIINELEVQMFEK